MMGKVQTEERKRYLKQQDYDYKMYKDDLQLHWHLKVYSVKYLNIFRIASISRYQHNLTA